MNQHTCLKCNAPCDEQQFCNNCKGYIVGSSTFVRSVLIFAGVLTILFGTIFGIVNIAYVGLLIIIASVIVGAFFLGIAKIIEIAEVNKHLLLGLHRICQRVDAMEERQTSLLDKIDPPDPPEEMPVITCKKCNESHDFDYPLCPHCGHEG